MTNMQKLRPDAAARHFIHALANPPVMPALPLLLSALHNPKTPQERMEERLAVIQPGADPAPALSLARGANTRGNANILIRPDAALHPWLILDDLPIPVLEWLASRRAGLFVQTSTNQGQARLLCDAPISPDQRKAMQKALIHHLGAGDPGATSGNQPGRLPGFTNRKPGNGAWTNLLFDTTTAGQRLRTTTTTEAPEPEPPLLAPQGGAVASLWFRGPARDTVPLDLTRADRDTGNKTGSEDLREFSFACHQLRHGHSPQDIEQAIAVRAMARGKRRTEASARQYAERTLRAAQARLDAR